MAGWIALLYLVSVGLLFASRVREFADETDNLLGGLLLSRGEQLYVDYFSSHMPLAYYIAAVPALVGATTLEQFRLFSNTLLVAATLGIAWAFRTRLSVLILGTWATLTIFAHTLQWGEMLTATTIAGFGVLVAGLIFSTTPDLHFSGWGLVGLSAAVFVAAQSELVAIFPLLVLGLVFLAARAIAIARRRERPGQAIYETAKLLATVAAPHLVLLGWFWVRGSLSEFFYDAYQFNVAEYSHFLMAPTVLGILHDWEAQYRAYLLASLQDPLGAQAALIVVNFFATFVVFRSRGIWVAAAYYLFVALTHVRNEGAYYVCSYFSLALCVAYAVGVLRTRPLVAAAVGLISLNLSVQVATTYDLVRRPIESPFVPFVERLTTPGEQIFVAPYDPFIYLAANRMPASRFPFYFPWQAIDPRSEGALIEDLRRVQPPVIIYRRNELVNGQWRLGEYGTRVSDFLASAGYVTLDTSSPLLRDILVRQDRLTAAREQLQLVQADP